MAFLQNKEMNLLNIHSSVVLILNQMYLLFLPLFLYQEGIPTYMIFIIFGVSNIARIPFRLLTLPLIRYIGLKSTLIVGIIGFGGTLSIFSQVDSVNIWLFIIIVILALFSAVYWTCYHTFYTISGENEHRGKHVAVGQSLGFCMAAIFPLFSAFMIQQFGFHAYFFLAIPLAIITTIPILLCSSYNIPKMDWKIAKKAFLCFGTKRSIAQSYYFSVYTFPWVIVLIIAVGSITSVAWIVAFGVIAQVLLQLFLGHSVDNGKMKKVINWGCIITAISVTGRSLLPLLIPIILIFEGFFAVSNIYLNTASMVPIYNDGYKSNNVLWYWIFSETGWDIGSILGFSLIAILSYAGMSLQYIMLFSLIGIGALWVILRQHETVSHQSKLDMV